MTINLLKLIQGSDTVHLSTMTITRELSIWHTTLDNRFSFLIDHWLKDKIKIDQSEDYSQINVWVKYFKR